MHMQTERFIRLTLFLVNWLPYLMSKLSIIIYLRPVVIIPEAMNLNLNQ